MKLPDDVFDRLPRLRNKIKVNVQKTIKAFSPYSDLHASSLTLTNTHGI